MAWWLGGDEAQKGLKFAGGEQATAVMGLLLLCRPSEVRSLENMARASGKLGGVAGVLLGVHICSERTQVSGGLATWTPDSYTYSVVPRSLWGRLALPLFPPASPQAASTGLKHPLALSQEQNIGQT